MKRFWQWTQGAFNSAGQGISSVKRTWSNRYSRLRDKSFHEMEAAEVLHSASFQKILQQTKAHSSTVQQYDRFAVTCGCEGFDPQNEFELKFENSERAFEMASVGLTGAPPKIIMSQGFKIEILGGATLHMTGTASAATQSFAFIRTGLPFEMGAWKRTSSGLLSWLAGISQRRTSDLNTARKFKAFEAFFACGTRVEMHRAFEASMNPVEMPHWVQEFKTCVTEGGKSNAERRKTHPGRVWFQDDIVVHVSFVAKQQSCYSEAFAKTSEVNKEKN